MERHDKTAMSGGKGGVLLVMVTGLSGVQFGL